MKSQFLLILGLSLLAVPQTALGQSSATSQGENEGDLSGNWLVSVHLTTKDDQETDHDYKATITFVPMTKAHYTASGHWNYPPKTDEETIYNVYFQSCARCEGHDIENTSPGTYSCSYEYGVEDRYGDGTTVATVYKGDLSFELSRGALRGKTRFLVQNRKHGPTVYSEEAEWTGERRVDR